MCSADKSHFSEPDLHYQSLFLTPGHSNKNLRCVVTHISLEEPREAAIVINFGENGTRNVGIDALVGLLAFVALFGFLLLMLAWSVFQANISFNPCYLFLLLSLCYSGISDLKYTI